MRGIDNQKNVNMNCDDKRRMIEELHAELEWYTKEASQEEFDPKAVESILYLLDIYEPLEDACTDVDEAWERFKMTMEERKLSESGLKEKRSLSRNVSTVVTFVQKRKIVVAAVLVVLLLALVGTTQAEAIKQNGFFFWLHQDEEGRQMITSPESLESTLNKSGSKIYYDRSELPEWCEELQEVERGLDEEESLEWDYIKVMQLENFNVVKSYYTDLLTRESVVIGLICYAEKVTMNTELFEGYSYVDSFGEDSNPMCIYNRVEESGSISYRIGRFEENYIYFVEGKDFDMIRDLAEKYLKK